VIHGASRCGEAVEPATTMGDSMIRRAARVLERI
jgi:hypothetical protein